MKRDAHRAHRSRVNRELNMAKVVANSEDDPELINSPEGPGEMCDNWDVW